MSLATLDWARIFAEQSMQALVDCANDDWGNVELNAAKAMRTGISIIDEITKGIRPTLVGIIGRSGSRKSSIAANMALYNGTSSTIDSEERIHQVILTAESGMSPKRYRDMLLAMLATKYLMYWASQRGEDFDSSFSISADTFYYQNLTEEQQKAVAIAKRRLSQAPITILGSGDMGAVDAIENYPKIFAEITSRYPNCAVTVDHLHSIFTGNVGASQGGVYSDYEVLNVIVPVLAQQVKIYKIPVIAIGQVSTSSARLKQEEARGGSRFREECGLYLRSRYEKFPTHKVNLYLDKSRYSPDGLTFSIPIDPASGLVIGDGEIVHTQEVSEELTQNGYGGPMFAPIRM